MAHPLHQLSLQMQLETRVLTGFCFAAALLASRPTYADTYAAPLFVERADKALANALPILFKSGQVETRTLPAGAGARHAMTLGEIEFPITSRLDIRAGAGLAAVVDAPSGSEMAHTGCAFAGTATYTVSEMHGFRLSVELTTLRVSYGGSNGFTDQTMLLAFSTR